MTLDLVRAKLHARIGGGIDVDKIFVTGSIINDQGMHLPGYSESLASAFFLQLQDNQVPVFGSGLELYSVRYSLDKNYLVSDLPLEKLNQYGIEMAPTFLG